MEMDTNHLWAVRKTRIATLKSAGPPFSVNNTESLIAVNHS